MPKPRTFEINKTKYITKNKVEKVKQSNLAFNSKEAQKIKKQKHEASYNTVSIGNKVRIDFNNGDFYFG